MTKIAKQITISHEGTTYTLEFNRKAVERLERQGFVLDDVVSKPLTTLPALFHGAFYMHHSGITRERTDAILYSIADTTGLVGRLADMYNDPVLALIGDEESETKNVKWDASW